MYESMKTVKTVAQDLTGAKIMVELTTAEETTEAASSIGDFTIDDVVGHLAKNIQENPQAQLQVAQIAQQKYGIDPSLLASIFPPMADTLEKAEKQQQKQAKKAKTQAEAQKSNSDMEVTTKEVEKKPKPEQVLGFIDEAIEFLGEDETLGELKEFGEDNPNMLQTAIDMGWKD